MFRLMVMGSVGASTFRVGEHETAISSTNAGSPAWNLRVKLCLQPAIGDRRGGAYPRLGVLDRASSPGRAAQQPLGGGVAAEEDGGEPIEIGIEPDVDLEGMSLEKPGVVALEADQQAAIATRRTIERQGQAAMCKIG